MNAADLRDIRLELGLSQSQLAKVLRTTLTTIARRERGEIGCPPTIELMYEELRAGWRPATFPVGETRCYRKFAPVTE